MKELIEFVKLSKYAGERFDLVQAGGGNLSIKLENGDMYIKASGFSLSEAEIDKGHVIVNNLEVLKILENKEVLSELRNRNVCKAEMLMNNITHNISNKPSIETFLHSLLYKYTLHTHPIAVNIIACKVGWREILAGIFPDALLINYETPGILLAVELKKSIIEYEKTYGKKPNIIMLQNHGLIVSSDSQDDIIEMMESVLLKIENYLCINFEQYKLTNKL
ncbi:MAG: class II aldolase/adducin family protein [Bacteroidota bacterium]|nr:class II aldolase/adducin family protein [Bacteroidota bacterium]